MVYQGLSNFFVKKLTSSIYIKLFPIILFFITALVRICCVCRIARPHYTIKSKLYRFRLFFSYFQSFVYLVSMILGYLISQSNYWLSESPDYGLIYLVFFIVWIFSAQTLRIDNNRHLRPALWNHKLFWLLEFIFQIGSFIYDLYQATQIRDASVIIDVLFIFGSAMLFISIFMREHSGLYNFVVQRQVQLISLSFEQHKTLHLMTIDTIGNTSEFQDQGKVENSRASTFIKVQLKQRIHEHLENERRPLIQLQFQVLNSVDGNILRVQRSLDEFRLLSDYLKTEFTKKNYPYLGVKVPHLNLGRHVDRLSASLSAYMKVVRQFLDSLAQNRQFWTREVLDFLNIQNGPVREKMMKDHREAVVKRVDAIVRKFEPSGRHTVTSKKTMRSSVSNSERPSLLSFNRVREYNRMGMTVYQKQRPTMLDSKPYSYANSDRSSLGRVTVKAKILNWYLSSAGNFYEYEITLFCPEIKHETWIIRRSYNALRTVVQQLYSESLPAPLVISNLPSKPPQIKSETGEMIECTEKTKALMENALKVILEDYKLHTESVFAFLEMPLYQKLMKRKAQARKGSFLFKNIEKLNISVNSPIQVQLVDGVPHQYFLLHIELEMEGTQKQNPNKFILLKTFNEIQDLHQSLVIKLKQQEELKQFEIPELPANEGLFGAHSGELVISHLKDYFHLLCEVPDVSNSMLMKEFLFSGESIGSPSPLISPTSTVQARMNSNQTYSTSGNLWPTSSEIQIEMTTDKGELYYHDKNDVFSIKSADLQISDIESLVSDKELKEVEPQSCPEYNLGSFEVQIEEDGNLLTLGEEISPSPRDDNKKKAAQSNT